MSNGRCDFGCGTMSLGSQQAIIAVGGIGLAESISENFQGHQTLATSVEILIPSNQNSIWLAGNCYFCHRKIPTYYF